MSTGDRPVEAVEFDFDGVAEDALPGGPALVVAAAEAAADRVVVSVRHTADGWAVVHPRPTIALPGGRVAEIEDLDLAETADAVVTDGGLATLEEVVLAAHRRGLGLVLRVTHRAAIAPLSAALGLSGAEGHAELRRRFLAVVGDQATGRRLRTDAPDLPSALELARTGGGWRGALGRRTPILARAAADADDLVLPYAPGQDARSLRRVTTALARRGAYLWLAGVPAERRKEVAAAGAEIGLGGLFVRLGFPGRGTSRREPAD